MEISSTVSKSLRKKPRDRYRSVRDFLRDFEESMKVYSGEESGAWTEIDMTSTVTDLPLTTIKKEQPAPAPEPESTEEPVEEQVEQRVEEPEAEPEPAPTRTPQTTEATRAQEPPVHMRTEVGLPLTLDRSGALKGRTRPRLGPRSVPGATASDSNSGIGQLPEISTGAGEPIDLAPSSYQPIKYSYTITSHGTQGRALTEPSIVCYRSGRLIVADTATRQIHLFSRDGRWICDLTCRPEITGSRTSGGRLTKPSGVAIDERGRIYVCDSSDHFIRVFDSQGVFVKEFKNIKGAEGGLQGITIDSAGLLYVSDASNGCLQVFQSDMGVWMRSIAVGGNGKGMLQLPAGLATDRLNRIYVVDYGTCTVSIFNKAGTRIRSFGKKGSGKAMFNIPRSVAVDRNDRIFVLDSLNHRIQVFGSAGDWLYSYGALGDGEQQLKGPSSLSLDMENSLLFVADKGNRRVQVYDLGFK